MQQREYLFIDNDKAYSIPLKFKTVFSKEDNNLFKVIKILVFGLVKHYCETNLDVTKPFQGALDSNKLKKVFSFMKCPPTLLMNFHYLLQKQTINIILSDCNNKRYHITYKLIGNNFNYVLYDDSHIALYDTFSSKNMILCLMSLVLRDKFSFEKE